MANSDDEDLPRLLIPVTILFAVRFVVRTGLVQQLRAHAVPVVGVSWDDPDLCAELATAGVEAVRLPESWVAPAARAHLALLATAFAQRLNSPSTTIDRARLNAGRPPRERLKCWLRSERDGLRARRPGATRRASAHLQASLFETTNLQENLDFLAEHRIDAVFSVTPFVAQEEVLLMAAEQANLATCTSILSFDNITTRPPLPIMFDRYLLWNRFNRDEILRGTPMVDPAQVTIVGPAQFDFYADPTWVSDERSWRTSLGLNGDCRTILYGAGPASIAPHEDQYVEDLVTAIREGELPDDLRIILRRHPMDDPTRWERFRADPLVAFDDPGKVGTEQYRPGHVNLRDYQVERLCTTLAHTDIHVSVSSTMSLDGAFFDKPQIAPAYDTRGRGEFDRHARALYSREHFIPIIESGGINVVTNRAEMVASIVEHLERPDTGHEARTEMLGELCTFTDGCCTERVSVAVGRWLAETTHS